MLYEIESKMKDIISGRLEEYFGDSNIPVFLYEKYVKGQAADE